MIAQYIKQEISNFCNFVVCLEHNQHIFKLQENMEPCFAGLVIMSAVLLLMAMFIGVSIYLVCSPVKTRRLNEVFGNADATSPSAETDDSDKDQNIGSPSPATVEGGDKVSEEDRPSENKENKEENTENTVMDNNSEATKLLNAVKDAVLLVRNKKESMGNETIVFVLCSNMESENGIERYMVLDNDAVIVSKLLERDCQTMAVSDKESVELLFLDGTDIGLCMGLLTAQETRFTCIR